MANATMPLATLAGGLIVATLTYDDVTLDLVSVTVVNGAPGAMVVSIQGRTGPVRTVTFPAGATTTQAVPKGYKLVVTDANAAPPSLGYDFTLTIGPG